VPHPFGSGGRGTLDGERGGGRVPIPTMDIHCGTLYICVYFVLYTNLLGWRIFKEELLKEMSKTLS
jgi:hypothetical protein